MVAEPEYPKMQSLSHRTIRCDSRRREGIYIKGEYKNETDKN